MSRTKQSWNCSHQRERPGIAHGLRMVRLHVGECHVRVLIDDDDTITIITIWRVVFPHLTNATPFALWKTICQGLPLHLLPSSLQWCYRKNHHFEHHGCRLTKKQPFVLLGKNFKLYGKPSEPITIGQGQDICSVGSTLAPEYA